MIRPVTQKWPAPLTPLVPLAPAWATISLMVDCKMSALAATKPTKGGDGCITLLVNSGWAWTLDKKVSGFPS